ncbi:hypothetical protein AB4Z46_20995 [Variovorax sp. M-6]|uniref:hypothetical protein n=1 Tax=Variovorax sp. M-6 TaxID=3233041 RepID=UPI003F99B2DB
MNIVWSYVAAGILTLVAGLVVAGGEPAVAELRLAEAATTAAAAGVSVVCLLVQPAGKAVSARAAAPIE